MSGLSYEEMDKLRGILLVGFDSAWTSTNSGALVGVLGLDDGTFHELGPPRIVDYPQARRVICEWQAELMPTATIVLLDQPTVVKNAAGRRPVEKIVGPSVGRRRGGMQPANTSKEKMFGKEAPMWPFLTRFGGPADPLEPLTATGVLETYPVLAMIALAWELPDSRPAGRLPKYNPKQKETFSNSDWQHVCELASRAFRERGLMEIVRWIDAAQKRTSPCKSDQDGLDAYLCLLVALYLAEGKNCLMVGDRQTGYIVVPYGAKLCEELETDCNQTGRAPSEWVQVFRQQRVRKSPSVFSVIIVGREAAGLPRLDSARAEGGTLGTGRVKLGLPEQAFGSLPRRNPVLGERAPRQGPNALVVRDGTRIFRCPIAGCDKVYVNARAGWDSHVGSLRKHRHWHLELRSADERKRQFEIEFRDFFR